MNRLVIKPARRLFSKRQQWSFDLLAGNGEPLHPNETVFNREELIGTLTGALTTDPLELVVLDRFGNVEERRRLR